MALAVVGVIGPGLFQLKPPQWLGADSAEQYVEMLAPPAELGGEIVALNAVPPVSPSSGDRPPRVPVDGEALTLPVDTVTLATIPSATQAPLTPAAAVARKKDAASQPLRGPNAQGAETQLAALQQGGVPERPAVKARRKPPSAPPAVPAGTTRPAKAPAVPPALGNSAPVPVIVARDFTRNIPDSHQGLPVQQQKDSFVAIVLPLILAANEEIAQRRSAIFRAADGGDAVTLRRWAKLYRVSTDDKSAEQIKAEILKRADFVPVSLALAQAAIESGWGTSRFARQGNALFGQWAWQASAGIKPAQASNSRAVVRSFPNLFGSVRAYMHNLNTHPSYASFRERRRIMRGRSRADLGYQLAIHLDNYAEIGTAYVTKLQTLIRTNKFGRFETAKLR